MRCSLQNKLYSHRIAISFQFTLLEQEGDTNDKGLLVFWYSSAVLLLVYKLHEIRPRLVSTNFTRRYLYFCSLAIMDYTNSKQVALGSLVSNKAIMGTTKWSMSNGSLLYLNVQQFSCRTHGKEYVDGSWCC